MGVGDIFQDKGILVVYTCWYDLVLWTLYPFDPSECMKVFELVGVSSFGCSGINWANESLIDLMLCNPFPFDPGVVFKCVECGSNTIYHLHDSSVVLLLDPMCLNGFVHPWHGVGFVIANTNPHAMRILFLFALPMVLQGMDCTTNPLQEGENDVIQITSRLSIHEFQCFDGMFTRMEVVGVVWMPRRGFHALHGNTCTLKELLVRQHHAWMIAWSVRGLTK
ncbi:hypothetical protein KY290_013018 [Solanum tuberosum]|uniref:Uncharacterized protein n=1 Tax=Solanum tuberosum TaxID=4113 RepID=A0ABQ7VNG3_SOLTU|nr:hypothetical protein KY290_013018 [Solanum tuberosum]